MSIIMLKCEPNADTTIIQHFIHPPNLERRLPVKRQVYRVMQKFIVEANNTRYAEYPPATGPFILKTHQAAAAKIKPEVPGLVNREMPFIQTNQGKPIPEVPDKFKGSPARVQVGFNGHPKWVKPQTGSRFIVWFYHGSGLGIKLMEC